MQVRRTGWLAYTANRLAARHAISRTQDHTGRLQMPVEGQECAAIGKDMFHHDCSAICTPPPRRCVGHLAVPNAVDLQAKRAPTWPPPVLAGVIPSVVGAVLAKVVTPDDILGVGRIERIV